MTVDVELRLEILENAVRDLERRLLVATPNAVVRFHELVRLWPTVSRSTWRKWIDAGVLRSHTIGRTRARFVVVADVERVLMDAGEGCQGFSTPGVANDDDESCQDDRDEEQGP